MGAAEDAGAVARGRRGLTEALPGVRLEVERLRLEAGAGPALQSSRGGESGAGRPAGARPGEQTGGQTEGPDGNDGVSGVYSAGRAAGAELHKHGLHKHGVTGQRREEAAGGDLGVRGPVGDDGKGVLERRLVAETAGAGAKKVVGNDEEQAG